MIIYFLLLFAGLPANSNYFSTFVICSVVQS